MLKKGSLLRSNWPVVCTTLLAVVCVAPFMWGSKAAAAEEPVVTWEKTYDNLGGLMKHREDGFYFAQLEGDEIKLVMMNGSGKVKTHKTFAKKEIDRLASFTQKKEGGYVFAGWTKDNQLYVMEVNGSGKLKWEKTLEGKYDSFRGGVDVAELQNGDIVLAAEKDLHYLITYNDIYLAKLTNNGEIIWEKTLGDTNDYYDKVSKVVPTDDGGFLFLGELGIAVKEKPSYGNYTDMYVVKFDPSGNQEWDKTYESGLNTEPQDAIETADGGFLIAANNYSDYTIVNIDGYFKGYYMKLDKSGKLEWDATLPESISASKINDIEQTEDGGFIIAGRANYDLDQWTWIYTEHAYFRKIDQSGQVKWEKVIEKGDREIKSTGVFQTEDGGYRSVIEEGDKLWHVVKLNEK
ncbi:hypothetical protein MUG84_25060 [Paenibacillus sp. KQZ6P-2]|uniref:Uncharacterized protein n=1 Tax=Paenibacillus mangrovi TaxID=2931978 RepID=A0A9X2B8V1_9BACL|nr:hypothetical protein [Paenibacillus mangrovi]MCJ8014958.1 hypothetical protein [Paenibacillus mangrovi]